jgi:hypothetical protein
MTLQNHAEPARVFFPDQVLAGVGHPNVSAGGDGVAQSRHHLLDLSQIIGRGGFPDLECEDSGDDHAVFGGPDREHLRVLLCRGIPKNQNRISFHLCHA